MNHTNKLIDIIIATGHLLGHLRGVYKYTKKIIEIVEQSTGLDELVDEIADAGLGF